MVAKVYGLAYWPPVNVPGRVKVVVAPLASVERADGTWLTYLSGTPWPMGVPSASLAGMICLGRGLPTSAWVASALRFAGLGLRSKRVKHTGLNGGFSPKEQCKVIRIYLLSPGEAGALRFCSSGGVLWRGFVSVLPSALGVRLLSSPPTSSTKPAKHEVDITISLYHRFMVG
jgi:hypothetical protein